MVLFREMIALLQNMPSTTKLAPPHQGQQMPSPPGKRNSKFRYLLSTLDPLEKRILKTQAVVITSEISLLLDFTTFLTL